MEDSMRPPGMRDMLPDDMERFRLIESAFRTACLGWGYREVRTPTIERLHLFTAAGTLSPQMLDRVYSFLDWDGWSGERVVLRPDSTIPVARLYTERLETGATRRQALLRSERPPLLRGRRLPRGLAVRRRAHRRHLPPRRHRAHPDRLRGAPEPRPDSRNQALRPRHPPHRLLRRRLRSGRAARRLRPRPRRRFERALRGPRTPAQRQRRGRLSSSRWRATAPRSSRTCALSSNPPSPKSPASSTSSRRSPKSSPASARRRRSRPPSSATSSTTPAPSFHLFVDGTKVAGGGRYDALIQQVGGEAVPASGFALEMEPLAALLASSESAAQPAVAISSAGRNGTDMGAVFSLARALRDAGVDVRARRCG